MSIKSSAIADPTDRWTPGAWLAAGLLLAVLTGLVAVLSGDAAGVVLFLGGLASTVVLGVGVVAKGVEVGLATPRPQAPPEPPRRE